MLLGCQRTHQLTSQATSIAATAGFCSGPKVKRSISALSFPLCLLSCSLHTTKHGRNVFKSRHGRLLFSCCSPGMEKGTRRARVVVVLVSSRRVLTISLSVGGCQRKRMVRRGGGRGARARPPTNKQHAAVVPMLKLGETLDRKSIFYIRIYSILVLVCTLRPTSQQFHQSIRAIRCVVCELAVFKCQTNLKSSFPVIKLREMNLSRKKGRNRGALTTYFILLQ